jgi:hypothetical protein
MKIRVLHPPPLLLSPWRYRPLLKAVVGAARQSFSPHHHRPIIEHAKAPISPLVTTLHSRRQKAVNAAKIRAAGAIFPLPLVSSIAPPFPSLFGLLLTFCSFLSAPRPRCRRRWPPMHLHRPRTSPPRAPPPPHQCWRPLVSHVAAYLAWHVPLGPLLPSFPTSSSITGRRAVGSRATVWAARTVTTRWVQHVAPAGWATRAILILGPGR